MRRVVGRDDGQRVRCRALRREQRRRGAAAHVVERHDLVAAPVGRVACASRRAGPHGDEDSSVGVPRGPQRTAPRRSASSSPASGEASCIGHRARGYAVHFDASARGRRATCAWSSAPTTVTLAEAVADLELALVSRCLDDREIALRQQNRAFFQISGAGHEALLLGLARSLRAGYDWFFPYYRDRALALALGVTPDEMLLQAVGAADDPGVGRPADAVPLGRRASSTSSARRRAPAASACPRSAARKRRATSAGARTSPAAPRTATSSPTCRSARARPPKASSGSRSTPRAACTSRCSTSSPTTATRSRCGSTDQAPAPISEMVRGIRGLHIVKMDGRDYFEVRRKGADAIAHVRAGAGPCLVHALVTRPYSHSLSDDQKKYRGADELADEAEHDPIVALEQRARRARACSTADQVEAMHDAARERVRAAAEAALAAPRARRRRACSTTWSRPPTVTTVPGEPETSADAPPVTFGEAIRLTLHEQMATDERIRVFGEDVADADPHVIDEVAGQGRRVRHHVRAAARVRRRPLLQHAARRGEHHRPRGRPGDARPAAVRGDPVLRLRVAGDEPAEVGSGHHPLAFERRVHVPDGRAHRDRRLSPGRRDLAQPVRRVDLRPRARPADRVPVARARRGRAAAHRVPERGPGALPRAQAPVPPGLQPRPDAARRTGCCRSARART